MAPLWAKGEYYSMIWDEGMIKSEAEGHLILSPK
jgi:hypothetical protein